MKQDFQGTLVRFSEGGVGMVDVADVDQYVYFRPGHIVGYRGETVPELKTSRHGGWVDGSTVVVTGEVSPSGVVRVDSVDLKR